MGKRSQYVFLAERNSVSHGFWDWPEGRGRGRELESRLHFAARWLYTPPFLDVGVHLWNLETSYSSTHAQEKKKRSPADFHLSCRPQGLAVVPAAFQLCSVDLRSLESSWVKRVLAENSVTRPLSVLCSLNRKGLCRCPAEPSEELT